MQLQLETLQKKWNDKGFKEATAIQERVYDAIKNGEDIVAISPTGTGKTLAYVLPLLELVSPNHELQTLVVAPSQELAQQIGEVIREWKPSELTMIVLAGGANIKRQLKNLKKKPEIVVGTPGRLMELSQSRKLKLHQLQTIVLDEADYLLQPEHLHQTRELIKKAPSQRQVLCFSATKNDTLSHLSQWLNVAPTMLEVTHVETTQATVQHAYVETPVRKKDELLRKFANMQQFQALVFVNSLANAGILAEKLAYHHIPCALLTSDAHQSERKAAIQAFKKGEVPLLLTTDVASRGLDVEDLPVVIHYDLPESAEVYTHRSGRTGRMGKAGLVLSFVTEKEVRTLKKLVPQGTTLEAYQIHASELKQAEKKDKSVPNRPTKRSKAPTPMKRPKSKQKKTKNKGARKK